MLAAIVLLAIVIILLLLQRERELIRNVSRETSWQRERKSLLDRIQFPERIQVEPGPLEPVDVPIDAAELAHVGEVVPHFVNVGSES